MGNGESRLKQRLNDIDDLNTVGINFLGGNGCHPLEFLPPLPADKLVIASLSDSKDPLDAFQINTVNFNANNEKNIKAVYYNIMQSLVDKKKRMSRKFEGTQDKLATLTG